jgi:hypothetical protein
VSVLAITVPGYRSRGPGFDSRRYKVFWEVVGLERGPLSLVRINEELLEWKSSGSRKSVTLTTRHVALTSPISGGRSVGIVRLRTKATEFSLCHVYTSRYSSRQSTFRLIHTPAIRSNTETIFPWSIDDCQCERKLTRSRRPNILVVWSCSLIKSHCFLSHFATFGKNIVKKNLPYNGKWSKF